MENPAPSIVVAIAAPVAAEFVKLTFRALYMRRAGPGSREMTVPGRPSDQLGRRVVTDSPVYDGRGADARLVARIQGVTVLVGNADALFTMVFETDRLKGSTLVINGMVTDGSDEWAIYGGTGVFAMATGVMKRRNLAGGSNDGNSDELALEVFCPVFGASQQPISKQQDSNSSVTKIGLWGGQGGSAQDITAEQPPRRLHSITVRAGVAVDSIEFTYTDDAGQRRTAGRWGGLGGNVQTIDIGSTEYVREVSGTYGAFEGAITLTSLRLVTSSRTWGPWGVENGTRFSITAPNGSSIAGFYARAGTRLVDAIGVYIRPVVPGRPR
ncbi:Salt stress-induced protein [Zea mays]|uniref:Dirigent protein n=1 Tax=Zea mays TaxID=4577 RepID=A0A3L6EAZ9_MAIZE|nr:Salt stress-induced protein [Zea mays]